MPFFFLSSGAFLGWSLGANDASNVFGTAVGARMIKFRTAAWVCSIFVTLGAVVSGAGASHTLGKLGSVDALAGAFMVAFSAGFTVFWMSKLKLPVSTSQAIVGAIIGWNLFAGALTDYRALTKIVTTWVVCPLLAAAFSMLFFALFQSTFRRLRIHLLRMDTVMRFSLLLVGAFGAYSLGANNIANVMGVFVPVAPFHDLVLPGGLLFSGTEQLFLLGGVAISAGVFTYSRKVMETVGRSLLRLSPEAALVVVLANAFVLFVFSSVSLQQMLVSAGFPAIPLVPVSSTQAVVGAVLGIGLLKRARGINFAVLGQIASGWVTTPIISGVIAFVALFFLQNVFNQQVYVHRVYGVDAQVIELVAALGGRTTALRALLDLEFSSAAQLDGELQSRGFGREERRSIVQDCERIDLGVTVEGVSALKATGASPQLVAVVNRLSGRHFDHAWQFQQALETLAAGDGLRIPLPEAQAEHVIRTLKAPRGRPGRG